MQALQGSIIQRNDVTDPSTNKDDLNAAINVPVTIRIASNPAGGGVLASAFDINGSPVSNPTTTDDNGNYLVYVTDGSYDVIANEGLTNETVEAGIIAGVDLSQDLSQAYIFDTVAEYKAFPTPFPVSKRIYLSDRKAYFNVITGSAATLDHNVIFSTQVNQSIDLITDSGYLYANEWGAVADADQDLGGGTDNLPVALALNEYADANNLVVVWQATHRMAYRFTAGWNLKVIHSGIAPLTHFSQLTKFVIDSPTPITVFTNYDGTDNSRAQSLINIEITSVQDKIHTLFRTTYYRGGFENCTFQKFDVVFDVDGVYVWFENLNITNNNVGLYPRPLADGTPSTMFYLKHVIFQHGGKGILFENRGFAIGENNDLLSMELNNCGFESMDTGMEVTQRLWQLTAINCWSEDNTDYGINIPDARLTEISCRWDDDIILPNSNFNSYTEIKNGEIRTREYVSSYKGNLVRVPCTSLLIVHSNGTLISSEQIPVTSVEINSGVLRIVLDEQLRYPSVTVTGVNRLQALTGSVVFENTIDANAVAAFGAITDIYCTLKDSTNTIMTPDMYTVNITWLRANNE